MNLFDFLYPKNCFGCGKKANYICLKCFLKASKANQTCLYCGKYSFMGKTHFSCLKPHSINGVYSPLAYRGVIRKSIISLKYKFASQIVKELSQNFANLLRIEKYPVKSATITPIPLHKKREYWRGFNQARELCGNIAEIMKWKFIPDLLIHTKHTLPQVGLKGKERRQNIKGVFTLNLKYQPLITGHRPLIIFDDVLTTGSTLKEAAKTLKRRGARKIWGLTIAK